MGKRLADEKNEDILGIYLIPNPDPLTRRFLDFKRNFKWPELEGDTSKLNYMKEEALHYMQFLGIEEERIRRFWEEGIIPVYDELRGEYLEPEEYPDMDRKTSNVTQYDPGCTYFVLRHVYAGYMMESLLFIGPYEDEWTTDRWNLQKGLVMTYTYNLDRPEFSEMGRISVIPTADGALHRVS